MGPEDQPGLDSAVPVPSPDAAFVRAFVALAVSDVVRGRLAAILRDLTPSGAHVAWVPPENIHLSLAFLGDIESGTVHRVVLLLNQIAASVAPFVFDSAGLGVFGSPRSPRVIWAGVRDAEPLRRLHGLLAQGLCELGLAVDEREFRPHLTLGRVRSPRGVEALGKVMERHAEEDFGGTLSESVHLMRSVLSPSGARYTLLHAVRFSAAEPPAPVRT
jgi:2'-5' RNA ligase